MKKPRDSGRKGESALSEVTRLVVTQLKMNGRPMLVKELANITCKRRCYDVILVLEAVGLVERKDKNAVEWVGVAPRRAASDISEKYWEDFDAQFDA